MLMSITCILICPPPPPPPGNNLIISHKIHITGQPIMFLDFFQRVLEAVRNYFLI